MVQEKNRALEKNSPLIEQYLSIKQRYQNSILLFQVGDFYELFFDDAIAVSAFLALTLTKRGKNKGDDIPLCGIPVHTLNHYLGKLVKGGFSVALCQQLSKPIPGTVVERAVTQVFTPGMLTDSTLLDEKSASYLLTIYPLQTSWGIIFTELLTAHLFATVITPDYRLLDTELVRFFPDEIIVPRESTGLALKKHVQQQGYCASALDYALHPKTVEEELFQDEARLWQEERFSAQTVKQLASQPALEHTLNMLYGYMKHHQSQALAQLSTINFYEPEDFLLLDKSTQRNLEILKNNNDGSATHTLFTTMDNAITPMGSRTIKKWLLRPLIGQQSITARHEVVTLFLANYTLLLELRMTLQKMGDFERIIGRIALGRATIADYRQLKSALMLIAPIKRILDTCLNSGSPSSHLTFLSNMLTNFDHLLNLLSNALNDDTREEWLIKQGFDGQLDYFRHLVTNGQEAINTLEEQEIKRTGIVSLKIGHTHQSGYYIEVTHTHSHRIPHEYLFQQKLVNRSRYITQQLKEMEGAIATAAEQQTQREALLYDEIGREVFRHLTSLRQCSYALCQIDALASFAQTAREENYVRPAFQNQGTSNLSITAGRHPVVERHTHDAFVPNDTLLDESQRLLIITGPNMGGKSTYLRQVALISIMAQCGSFVPAASAQLPIVDRIFTRIGSGDNVAQGKSTFLVEMEETALICTQATERSLVILDEVGRGTSTNDGLALAHAIIEYIHNQLKTNCLFATHYHELTLLADQYPTIANYHLTCQQRDQELIFLHHVKPGAAQASFGLDVARQAHIPLPIIYRAHELLMHYEEYRQARELPHAGAPHAASQAGLLHTAPQQAPFSNIPQLFHPALMVNTKLEELKAELAALDVDTLTPRAALDILYELKQRVM